MPDQAEVTKWAGLIATAYAENCVPPLSSVDLRDLMVQLDGPLTNCILLAVPPKDWGPDFVNPVLDRWEAATRRRRGRRLEVADYGQGRITMS